jgi:hypothetical protein
VQRHLAGLAGRRVARDHLDHAAGGVAAEQRALRPVEHFDPLDPAQVEQRADRRGEIDPVDIRRDAVLDAERRALADAAQVGLGERARAHHHQARHDLAERRHLGRLHLLERFAGPGGERDRHVLGAFGPALRGYQDRVVVVAGRRLRSRSLRASDGKPAARGGVEPAADGADAKRSVNCHISATHRARTPPDPACDLARSLPGCHPLARPRDR